jgi:hypothetical protein
MVMGIFTKPLVVFDAEDGDARLSGELEVAEGRNLEVDTSYCPE